MKDFRNLSDEELMMLYRQGETAAFDALYERHSGRVFGYFQKRAGSTSPSDLLQETFFKLHRSRDQYDPQYPFLPWLFTIAKNTLLDSSRKVIRDGSRMSPNVEIENLAAITSGEEIPQAVMLALDSLSPQQRRAVELRYMENWSFEEIAQKLKTSPSNVRQIISRSVKNLKGLLMEKEDSNES